MLIKNTKIQHSMNLWLAYSKLEVFTDHVKETCFSTLHSPYKVLPLLVSSTFDHQCYKFLLSLRPTS